MVIYDEPVENLDPLEMTVTLTWELPDEAGGDVLGFEVTRELVEGVEVREVGSVTTVGAADRTLEIPVDRTGVPDSYWRYSVAAVTADGAEPAVTADVVVPDVLGMCDWTAYQLSRVVGIRVDVTEGLIPAAETDYCRDDGGDGLIAQQKQQPGSVVTAGSPFDLRVYDYGNFE